MELSGTVDTPLGPMPVILREQLDAESTGEESIAEVVNTEAKDGSFADEGFLIDSSFDAFTELSLDGGASFFPNLGGPSRFTLVPEPSAWTLVLLGICGGRLVARRQRVRDHSLSRGDLVQRRTRTGLSVSPSTPQISINVSSTIL